MSSSGSRSSDVDVGEGWERCDLFDAEQGTDANGEWSKETAKHFQREFKLRGYITTGGGFSPIFRRRVPKEIPEQEEEHIQRLSGVCVYECIVTERFGSAVDCDAKPIGPDSEGKPDEFWEIDIPGCTWIEGDAFYMVIPEQAEETKACEHEWVDATNDVVLSGEICKKCLSLKCDDGTILKGVSSAQPETERKPREIGTDGRCTCSCADQCPLGRSGMALRCTESELRAAAIPIAERKAEAEPELESARQLREFWINIHKIPLTDTNTVSSGFDRRGMAETRTGSDEELIHVREVMPGDGTPQDLIHLERCACGLPPDLSNWVDVDGIWWPVVRCRNQDCNTPWPDKGSQRNAIDIYNKWAKDCRSTSVSKSSGVKE